MRLLLVNKPVTKIEISESEGRENYFQLSLIDIGVSYYRIYCDADYVVVYQKGINAFMAEVETKGISHSKEIKSPTGTWEAESKQSREMNR